MDVARIAEFIGNHPILILAFIGTLGALIASEVSRRLSGMKSVGPAEATQLSNRENAVFLRELRERGGAGKVFAEWPSDDYVGLLELLKKGGNRLGGMSAQYFLRFAGVDSFILSNDVNARLIAEGVIDKPATSKTARGVVGRRRAMSTTSMYAWARHVLRNWTASS